MDESTVLQSLGQVSPSDAGSVERTLRFAIGIAFHELFVENLRSWEDFEPLLASQAWYQGFAAAERKVFVSDGSSSIEKMQQTHFSHYTSVLDILHALSYSLAAARAVSNTEDAARKKYDFWAAKIWEGKVDDVIDELIIYQKKIGEPPPDASSENPREVIRTSRVYYEHHSYRMDLETRNQNSRRVHDGV